MSFNQIAVRTAYILSFICTIGVMIGIIFLTESKTIIFENSNQEYVEQADDTIVPFPVSVNIHTEIIDTNPEIDNYFYNTLANAPADKKHWWNQVAAVFASKAWYQNLASPISRIIVIWPGERKEEIAKNIGDVLGWKAEDRAKFISLIDSAPPILSEGKYFPGQYVSHKKATPEDIYQAIEEKFSVEILQRYTPEVEAQVPLQDALIIASLLEREASDFNNMREVAGVIWNRLFIDMPLQLDATLQYVKGGNVSEKKWWPIVKPRDKFLKSPYNTYSNKGLPPTPIANPSAEAVLAALNPIQTECLYYFHTDKGKYYCSKTYEEHVAKLKKLYGKGS